MTSCTLELGARTSWRNYGKGRVERKRDADGRTTYRHIPAKHSITVPDAIYEGLKVAGEEWKRANDQRREEGDLKRMIRVSDAKRVGDDPPADVPPLRAMADHIIDRLEKMFQNVYGKGQKT